MSVDSAVPNPDALPAADAADGVHAARQSRKLLYFRAMWSGAGARAVNIVTQVLALALTVRYLGQERYGMWATISSFVVWLGLANFGLGNGLTTRLSGASGRGDRAGADGAASSTVGIVSLAALLLLACGSIAAVFVPWHAVFRVSDPVAVAEARPTVMVTLWLVALILPMGLSTSILTGFQRGDLVNITSAVASLVGLACLLAATRLHAGMPLLAAVLVLPMLAASAAQWVVVRRLGLVRLSASRFSMAEALAMFRLGAGFLLVQLFAVVTFQTGAVIIAQRFGAAEVTPYSVTERMVLVIVTAFNVLIAPLWPAYGEAFARGDRDWVRRTFWKSARAVFLLWLPAAVGLGVFGQWVVRIWAGPDSVPSRLLLWSMLAYSLAMGMGIVVSHLLNGVGALSSQILGAGLMAAIHVPLAVYLCGVVGVAGVPISQGVLMWTIAIPLAFAHVLRIIRRTGAEPISPAAGSVH
jgi:O-antigen/teichoic acid export membrane protein